MAPAGLGRVNSAVCSRYAPNIWYRRRRPRLLEAKCGIWPAGAEPFGARNEPRRRRSRSGLLFYEYLRLCETRPRFPRSKTHTGPHYSVWEGGRRLRRNAAPPPFRRNSGKKRTFRDKGAGEAFLRKTARIPDKCDIGPRRQIRHGVLDSMYRGVNPSHFRGPPRLPGIAGGGPPSYAGSAEPSDARDRNYRYHGGYGEWAEKRYRKDDAVGAHRLACAQAPGRVYRLLAAPPGHREIPGRIPT